MEFKLSLTDRRKIKWLLLYVAAWASLFGGALVLAGKLRYQLSSFLAAGLMVVALAVFIAAYWLFERIQEAIRESVCITIWPSGLAETIEATGTTRSWQMSQLLSYRYESAARTGTFLLLRFRGGERVQWQTGDRGLSQRNREAFAAMAKALETAWAASKATR